MATDAKINTLNGRLVGRTGIYSSAVGLHAFDTPIADCGISLRDGFVSLRVSAMGEFTLGAAQESSAGAMILDTINEQPAGNTLLELFVNLSTALGQ
jgi:hypothetical protein